MANKSLHFGNGTRWRYSCNGRLFQNRMSAIYHADKLRHNLRYHFFIQWHRNFARSTHMSNFVKIRDGQGEHPACHYFWFCFLFVCVFFTPRPGHTAGPITIGYEPGGVFLPQGEFSTLFFF